WRGIVGRRGRGCRQHRKRQRGSSKGDERTHDVSPPRWTTGSAQAPYDTNEPNRCPVLPSTTEKVPSAERYLRLLARGLASDPIAHQLLEDIERHRAVPQHHVVVLANIEARPELLLGLRAQLLNLELADLVRERLPGP